MRHGECDSASPFITSSLSVPAAEGLGDGDSCTVRSPNGAKRMQSLNPGPGHPMSAPTTVTNKYCYELLIVLT